MKRWRAALLAALAAALSIWAGEPHQPFIEYISAAVAASVAGMAAFAATNKNKKLWDVHDVSAKNRRGVNVSG
jgi:hypothetical protein